MNHRLKLSGVGLFAFGLLLLGTTSVTAQTEPNGSFSIQEDSDFNINPGSGVRTDTTQPDVRDDLDGTVLENPDPTIGAPVLENDLDDGLDEDNTVPDATVNDSPFNENLNQEVLDAPVPPADGTRLDDDGF
ncbi:MAG: hypothetical protein Kow00121_39970 [Elainellaceae cyanobacterium]